MKQKRWQDWTNVLLGAWLVLAPVIGIGVASDAAVINSFVIGAAVALFAFAAIRHAAPWKEYTNLALGLWLIIPPFAFGFTNLAGLTFNQIIVGLLVGGVAFAAVLQTATTARHGTGHGHA